jgi:hypothetical protein
MLVKLSQSVHHTRIVDRDKKALFHTALLQGQFQFGLDFFFGGISPQKPQILFYRRRWSNNGLEKNGHFYIFIFF